MISCAYGMWAKDGSLAVATLSPWGCLALGWGRERLSIGLNHQGSTNTRRKRKGRRTLTDAVPLFLPSLSLFLRNRSSLCGCLTAPLSLVQREGNCLRTPKKEQVKKGFCLPFKSMHQILTLPSLILNLMAYLLRVN